MFCGHRKCKQKILILYGEQRLFEIVILARQEGWQVFDTGLGEMLNLNNPTINGYDNFNKHLEQILNG